MTNPGVATGGPGSLRGQPPDDHRAGEAGAGEVRAARAERHPLRRAGVARQGVRPPVTGTSHFPLAANSTPSLPYATARTAGLRAVSGNSRTGLPVSAARTFTSPSVPAVATNLPSGDTASDVHAASWSVSIAFAPF